MFVGGDMKEGKLGDWERTIGGTCHMGMLVDMVNFV